MNAVQAPLPSRLVARLESAIVRSRHPVEKACLRAERAGHLARQGQLDKAGAEVAALHAQFDRQPQASISAWLCVAEAFIAYFTSLSTSARDKLMRAQALSAAAGLKPLQALSAAWLAHMDLVAGDAQAMARHLREAIDLSLPSDHAVRTRVCLVMGTALHHAGRQDLAQRWYVRSREHALAEGDEATLSALMHNMAAQHSVQALQASVFGEGDAAALGRQALAGAEAARNFDACTGTAALDALPPMFEAMALSAQGAHAQALPLYAEHLEASRLQGLGRMGASFLADMAWCHQQQGDAQAAHGKAVAAAAALDAGMDSDDRALAHGRLGQVWRGLGEVEAALVHERGARDDWAMHRRHQAQIMTAVAPLPFE